MTHDHPRRTGPRVHRWRQRQLVGPAPLRRIYERFGISESSGAHLCQCTTTSTAGGGPAAKRSASDDELYTLLEEENLTVDELLGWGAPPRILQRTR